MRIITGKLTSREAGAQAGMDRSTSMALRKTAKDGAIAGVAGVGAGVVVARRREASELARLQAEDARLSSTIVEQAIELAALHGSRPGAEGPVPQGARSGPAAVSSGPPEPGGARPATHGQPTALLPSMMRSGSRAICRAKSVTPQRLTTSRGSGRPRRRARPS